jgi:hypothetical protein
MSCLAGMFTLVAVAATFAQSNPEPAVVISMAPLKEQMNDIKYLVDASGFGQAKFLIKTQIDYYTRGIDKTRPSGVFLYFEGDNPMPRTVIALPIKDFDDFLDTVSNIAEVDDEDDVIEIIPSNGETMYAVEKEGSDGGSQVFITLDKDSLEDLPEDPVAMLGDLPSKYNLAAHVFGSRVPEELREKAIDMIKDGYVDSLMNMGGDPDKIDSQIEDFEKQIKSLEDVDEIVVGVLADKDSHKMAMEFTLTGKPGSKVANSYAGFVDAPPSRFAGFMNDTAAMDYSMCFDVSTEDADQIGAQLDGLIESMMTEIDNDGEFDDEEMDTIRSVAVQFAEVVEETFKEGRIDSGGQLLMGENELNFAAGGQVADPAKVESAAKELIELLRKKGADEMFDFNLDFAKHNGINLHEIVFKVPDDEEELQDFVGSEIVLILGIGKKDVYLAAGKEPLEALKTAMANSGTAPEYPVIYNVRITPILEFAASTTGQPMLDGLVEKLKEVGRDKISIYSKAIDNGLFTRMEMEDGPLSLIQEAVQGGMSGGGPEF